MSLSVASEDIAGSPEFRHLTSIKGIAVDLRYAGPDNFVGRDLYSPFDCAWLHVEAAAALIALGRDAAGDRTDCAARVRLAPAQAARAGSGVGQRLGEQRPTSRPPLQPMRDQEERS